MLKLLSREIEDCETRADLALGRRDYSGQTWGGRRYPDRRIISILSVLLRLILRINHLEGTAGASPAVLADTSVGPFAGAMVTAIVCASNLRAIFSCESSEALACARTRRAEAGARAIIEGLARRRGTVVANKIARSKSCIGAEVGEYAFQ